MLSVATIKALQIYGLAIVISMLVAVMIKVLVSLTSRKKPVAKAAVAPQAAAPVAVDIPAEVVAAISAAVYIITGQHHILHIAASNRSWANEGRIAQHSHHPRH